ANPLAELSRAVAIGEVDGPLAGLRALDAVGQRLGDHHRLHAVRAHLHERAGDPDRAAGLFALAARSAPSAAERDHLLRRAAQAGQAHAGDGVGAAG
ncbi:MAG: RNA polymerase subunit sigma-24, partial [Cellulomonadaceae bacterium]|nr:RNA polymerase subunit sigma-24 [Cellulomonadaceae bacterium]